MIDFVEPALGQPLLSAFQARRDQAEGGAVIDYCLHMTLRQADDKTPAEIPALARAGCPSFKTYLTYEGIRLDDANFLAALQAVRAADGIVLVHAENHHVSQHLTRALIAAGQTAQRTSAFSTARRRGGSVAPRARPRSNGVWRNMHSVFAAHRP